MKPLIALLLALAPAAHAQSVDLLLAIELAKAGLPILQPDRPGITSPGPIGVGLGADGFVKPNHPAWLDKPPIPMSQPSGAPGAGSPLIAPVKPPAAAVFPKASAQAPSGHWVQTKWYGCDGNHCGWHYGRKWVVDGPQRAAWPAYPSRSASGSHWIYNGGRITAAHLADPHGHHAREHFNRAWLNTLNQSQLTALGSDCHEGRVREQFVVRDR